MKVNSMKLVTRLLPVVLLTLFGKTIALKNVLVIIVDDLRPEVGVWSDVSPDFYQKIMTPNMDALAGKSLVLKQTYCQQPRCNPSRTSFLTARRIESTGIVDRTYWRDLPGNFTTLPQHFKDMGYKSIGLYNLCFSMIIFA